MREVSRTGGTKTLVLAAMIFAVAMTFIDQTIVSIAVPELQYGEATGILQTIRNFAASLGLAILGTVLISQNRSNIESSFADLGISKERSDQAADALSQGGSEIGRLADQLGRKAKEAFDGVPADFALASRTIFYAMAGVMAGAFVVALIALPGGKVERPID